MSKALFFAGLLVLLVILQAISATQTNIHSINGITSYVYFGGHYSTSHSKAQKICARINGTLADIPNAAVLTYLANVIPEAAYVRSWEDDDYGHSCIALYPEGAIAVPPVGCRGPFPFLCEVSSDPWVPPADCPNLLSMVSL